MSALKSIALADSGAVAVVGGHDFPFLKFFLSVDNKVP